MKYLHIDGGMVKGVFANPQPDALDGDGNVIAHGTPTVEVSDDDPRISQYEADFEENLSQALLAAASQRAA